MVSLSKEAGADYILFGGGMTMRDAQANWYLKRLNDEYPELVDKYLEIYDAEIVDGQYKGKYAPKRSYHKKIHKMMFELCKKYNMPWRIKRYIPDDFRRENYIIAEEFLNEAYMEQSLGRPYSNLFWAGMNIQIQKESLRSIAARGELQKIRNIDEKLEERIKSRLESIKNIQKTF
jgi:hypothetical protein